DGNAIRFVDVVSGKYRDAPSGHRAGLTGVSFAADGQGILTHGRQPHVCLWDADTGRLVKHIAPPTGAVDFVASPDGGLLAALGKVGQTFALPEGMAVRGGAVSPDNRTLALDLFDGRVAVWELATGKQRLVLSAKPVPEKPLDWAESMSPVAFSPDGRLLAH